MLFKKTVTPMKKVFMSAAIVAIMFAAASCQCNSKKAENPANEVAEEIADPENETGPLGETGPLNK